MNISLKCPRCQHEGSDFKTAEKGQHTEATCAKCDSHIKFLSKEDKYGTKEQQAEIWEKTKGCCAYCGSRINPFAKRGLSYDHVIAQANGGGHETENLMLACFSCNAQKGKKTTEEYRQYLTQKLNKDYHFFWYEQGALFMPKHISEVLLTLYPNNLNAK